MSAITKANTDLDISSLLEGCGIDVGALNDVANSYEEGSRKLYATFTQMTDIRVLDKKSWGITGQFSWGNPGDKKPDSVEKIKGLERGDKIYGVRGYITSVERAIDNKEWLASEEKFKTHCSLLGYFDSTVPNPNGTKGAYVKAYPGGSYDLMGGATALKEVYEYDKSYRPTKTDREGKEYIPVNGALRQEKGQARPSDDVKNLQLFGIDSNKKIKRCADCIHNNQHIVQGTDRVRYCTPGSGQMIFFVTEILVDDGETKRTIPAKEVVGENGFLLQMNLPPATGIKNRTNPNDNFNPLANGFQGLLTKLKNDTKFGEIKPVHSSFLLNKIELALVPNDEKKEKYRYDFKWVPLAERVAGIEGYSGPEPVEKDVLQKQIKQAKAAWDLHKPQYPIEILDLPELLGEKNFQSELDALQLAETSVKARQIENILEDEEEDPFGSDD